MDTGEITKETVKTIRAGSAGSFWRTCGDYARVHFPFARETAGAPGIRHSLRPLLAEGQVFAETRAHSTPREGGLVPRTQRSTPAMPTGGANARPMTGLASSGVMRC